MQRIALFAILMALLLPFAVVAQDAPKPADTKENPKEQPKEKPKETPKEKPKEEPKELPELPTPPYVKEDADALHAHLDAATASLKELTTTLADNRKAAAEPGLSAEEKAKRDKAVEDAQTALTAAQTQVDQLTEAIKQAKEGPTRAELDARKRYDTAVALAKQVLADLSLAVERGDSSKLPSTPDGAYAKTIRDAEDEQKRIEQLAENAEEFEFSKSRVYDKLSDLEKLDYEMRWASERLQLSVDAYDHLNQDVFDAYKSYGHRAFEGLDALDTASAAWAEFKDSPARELKLPEAPADEAKRKELRAAIDNLYKGRAGQLNEIVSDLVVTHWRGKLAKIQQQIDIREDYKERLEQDAEKLKTALADSGDTPAAKPDDKKAKPDSELEDYQKLGKQIDDYKQSLKDNKDELDRLAGERAGLEKILTGKQQTEQEVQGLVDKTDGAIAAIEQQFTKAKPAGKPKRPPAEAPKYTRKPVVVLFTLRERLAAEAERLSSAKRDTRQVQTQVEIVDRRVERLGERDDEIEKQLLPDTRSRYYEEVGKTIGIRAAKVVGVLVVAWLLLFLIRKVGQPLIDRIVRRADSKSAFSADEQQRARTLMTVFMTTARVVVYITAILFAVAQFDVDYGPLLVAAGGVSLAVGFGAQSLVKDFFSGFFVLLEGQYSIGDWVEINGKSGTVENLNLRTTVLRGLNGDVHVIPNGQIVMTTNSTKIWSRAVIDVGIGYEENTDHVGSVMEMVAKEMREDEVWGKKVLDAIMMGVTELGDSAVTLRMLLKTRAGEQWGASREYLRRCKLKFDELGIEIPWPQRVVSYKSYKDQDDKTRDHEARKKRANLLRYVRRMRGEVTEEEQALAHLSVEERDRAETLANRQAELHKEKAEENEPAPAEQARPAAEQAKEQAELTDAEKLARHLATQKIKKQEADDRAAEAEAKPKPDTPPDEPKKE